MGAKVLGSVALLGGAISAGAGGALPEGASTAVIAAAAVATGRRLPFAIAAVSLS
jgi:hypothetical protein